MNKILILSDSHGLTNELELIKQRHQLQHMIHCGDSELNFNAFEMNGFVKVAGNCDFDEDYPEEQVIEIDDLKILVVHGHLHGVKGSLTPLSYRAEELEADVACYGHTHIVDTQKINDILFINPGSIRLPKVRKEKSYCIMEWDNKKQINVNYYTVDGEPIKSLSKHVDFN